MEQTITWDMKESSQMRVIEGERVQVLAQIGALMMDLENAKKNLEGINERHKAAIKQALDNRGIGRFDSARPFQNGVIITTPDNNGVQ